MRRPANVVSSFCNTVDHMVLWFWYWACSWVFEFSHLESSIVRICVKPYRSTRRKKAVPWHFLHTPVYLTNITASFSSNEAFCSFGSLHQQSLLHHIISAEQYLLQK
jgi:hypothetical protein